MTVGEAAVLGALQGFTEFLPVSSSGHLAAAHGLLGFKLAGGQLAFDVLVHVASLAAVLIVFRRDIIAAVTSEKRVGVAVAAATIPLAAALWLRQPIEEVFVEHVGFAGAALVFTGLMLYAGTRIPDGGGNAAGMSLGDAFKIGIAQLVALLPGVSRSGMTIVMGRAAGLEAQAAVTFAFLMFIPAVAGAGAVELPRLVEAGNSMELRVLAAGAAVSFISSILALGMLKSAVRRWGLGIFAVYCVLVGTAVLVLSFFNHAA